MIGTVEIYKDFGTSDQELLISEDNLLVNGAGESICTMLTTPSGIVSGAPHILDTSNFTIQALSLGKSSDAYKANAHFYPFEPSASTKAGRPYHTYVSAVEADNRIRAVSLINENVTWTASSYDPKRDPGLWPSPNDVQLEPDTHTAIDAVSGESHYMGSSVMQGRAHAYGHNLNRVLSNTNPNLLSYTDQPDDDPTFGLANWYWQKANIGTIVVSATHSGPFYGTSAFLVPGSTGNSNRLFHKLGWNHASPSAMGYLHRNVDHTFSLYAKLPEGNPTSSLNLQFFNRARNTYHQCGFSYVDLDTSAYRAPYFVSSVSGVSGTVTPAASANDSSGWYRFEAKMTGLGDEATAHNGDPFWVVARSYDYCPGPETVGGVRGAIEYYGWQVEESYGATKFQKVEGVRPSVNQGGIGKDIFLGCYPHTSGTDFAILESIENIDVPSPGGVLESYASGTYPETTDDNFFNSSSIRSMDQNGFIRTYMPSATGPAEAADGRAYPHKSASDPEGISNPLSGVIVSASTDFSSTGEVSYICTISSGDLGTTNMYGGLFKLGLWTIDLPNTMQGNHPTGKISDPIQPPFHFKAGFNRIVYKLFAEKNFTKNLAAIKDSPPYLIGKGAAGCNQYTDLTIVWRIQLI